MGNVIDGSMFPITNPTNHNQNISVIQDTNIEILFYKNNTNDQTILYSHGNGVTLDEIAPFLKQLSNLTRMSVLCYEYPTNPNTESVKIRISFVYKYLTRFCKPENIILLGRSIGSGPTMHMVQQLENIKIDSVVLISPFSSIKQAINNSHISYGILNNIVSYFVEERFKNNEIVENMNIPLLLIHGEQDKVLPPQMSKQLFDQYGGEKNMVKLKMFEDKTHTTMLNPILISQEIMLFRNHVYANKKLY